jgi:hypothetical protein
MKKYLIVLITMSFLLLSLGLSAQEGSSMASIYLKAAKYVKAFEDKGLEVVRLEFDIISKTELEKFTVRGLNSSYTYYIIASGDDRIKDLDVELGKLADQKVIKSEVSDKNIEVLIYKPTESDEFFINVKAVTFENGQRAGHFVLIVAHDLPE